MKKFLGAVREEFRSLERFERKGIVLAVICLVVGTGLILWGSEAGAQEPISSPIATVTPTATVDPEAQFRADKVAFCVNTVYYNYLKLKGIELRTIDATYVATDTGAEVTGLADSADERLTGIMHFKCVYRDFMGGSMILTDFDLTEGE